MYKLYSNDCLIYLCYVLKIRNGLRKRKNAFDKQKVCCICFLICSTTVSLKTVIENDANKQHVVKDVDRAIKLQCYRKKCSIYCKYNFSTLLD